MRKWLCSEDGWSVVVGFLIVMLGLANAFGLELLGWSVAVKEWVDPTKALQPASKTFASMTGWGSLVMTYLFLLGCMGFGAKLIGMPLRKFLASFTVIFVLAFTAYALGHYAVIASTPDKRAAFGLTWSMGLTAEAGYLVALLFGLFIGNFVPRLANWLKEAARPEWFVKTAIVILGASFGIKAAGDGKLASAVMVRGFAAIIEAYLIYWALVYVVARRVFGFSREWAAPLASGISICGVSAAITTGAAIRARPVVPIMVSSLVVIFAVMEMLVLPFLAQWMLRDQPMVAAAWMGLAVKTDGAAISSGAITASLITSSARQELGLNYDTNWLTMTTTTVKVFIDLFIGVWAIVLSLVWTYGIEKKKGQKMPLGDIWARFPKFVFGYMITFGVMITIGLTAPETAKSIRPATDATDTFRKLFFVLTFFSIGLISDFRKLWAEGLGKLALVYVVCLFGFIIWIGLAISFLFFHGVMPPLLPMKGAN